MIKKLNGELKEVKKGEPKINSDEAIKLKNAVKEKEKKAKDAEKDLKKFVDKIAELENQIKKFDINKYKDANAQLNEKKKEIKSIKDELEKATKRASDYQDIVNQKNSRICELETTNTRLQLMYNHSKEINDAPKDNPKEEKQEESKKESPNKSKCVYENSGNCRNKKCSFIHPKKTCQAHSRYGSCPSESICEHRHPDKMCFHLQKSGYCYEGERCRMRHPVEYGAQVHHERPFLGQGQGHGSHQGHQRGAGGNTHPYNFSPRSRNFGFQTKMPEEQNLAQENPFLSPEEPWSPPYSQYKTFNRGQGPTRGQRNQH